MSMEYNKYIQRAFFFVIVQLYVSLASTSYSKDLRSTSHSSSSDQICLDWDKKNIYGNEVLKAFIEYSDGINIENLAVSLPLKIVDIDWDEKPHPIRITKMVTFDQLSFPLWPNKKDREDQGLSVDMRFPSECIPYGDPPYFRFQVILYNTYDAYIYEFEKRDVPVLITIENKSLTNGKIVLNDWLEKLFPTMKSCTPINNLFFERQIGISNARFLEKLGYSPVVITDQFATYKINEVFFGLKAIELTIPAGDFSTFAITIDEKIEKVQENIYQSTGYVPGIEENSGNAKVRSNDDVGASGVVYLREKGNKTEVLCVTIEGE